jgi:hypothetical protein
MRINQFYELRQNDWKQLEHLLRQSQLGIHKLSPEAIETLGRLYRAASSDLALAQRDFGDHQVTLYLNQLVARAHAVVYRSEPLAYQRLLRFVTTGYPASTAQVGPSSWRRWRCSSSRRCYRASAHGYTPDRRAGCCPPRCSRW